MFSKVTLRIYEKDEMVFIGNLADYLLVRSKPKQTNTKRTKAAKTNTVTKTKILFAAFLHSYKGCQCHYHRLPCRAPPFRLSTYYCFCCCGYIHAMISSAVFTHVRQALLLHPVPCCLFTLPPQLTELC